VNKLSYGNNVNKLSYDNVNKLSYGNTVPGATPNSCFSEFASMEADWSQLPRELLQLISQKLNNSELYLLRFRSVCSTWRSSVPNYCRNNHSFLKQIPQFPNEIKPPTTSNRPTPTSNYVRCLSKQNIFLIKPPKQQTPLHPWLIRIGPDLDGITFTFCT
jgi:hypothetical protein